MARSQPKNARKITMSYRTGVSQSVVTKNYHFDNEYLGNIELMLFMMQKFLIEKIATVIQHFNELNPSI